VNAMARKAKRPSQTAPTALGDPVIAQNIKRTLDLRGLRPADLARKLNVSPQAVSQWLQCQTTPSTRRLAQIAGAVEVTVEMLRNKPAPVERREPIKDGQETFQLRPFRIGATTGAAVGRGDEWVVPAKDFQGLASDKPDLLIMRIAGNDLEPDLRAGDLVVADHQWSVVSAAGIYLLGDKRFPVLRRCELALGSESQIVLVHEHESTREIAAANLVVLGRVICKLLVPL
jgi:transcriptional regulator with XRE-family HTH domain